ncbi:MAG: hypothetical protein K2I42_07195 [Anaeroplasmataceae bacterium]|nr:hypothetical protein [Anaeroplasmataceae bacterium]
MKQVLYENFQDFELNEFPYDRGHTALGEYHFIKDEGYTGNFYDPIRSHQWRSLDGSWLVTSDGNKRYMEQNRGNNSTGAFENVYCCLVHKTALFAPYILEFDIRILEMAHFCGMGFHYLTSRNYYFIGIKENKIALFFRHENEFDILKEVSFKFDIDATYHFKIDIDQKVVVYLNDAYLFEIFLPFLEGRKVAFIAKSACRYSELSVTMTEKNYQMHQLKIKEEEQRISQKQQKYPKLKLIHKINLKNFGSGRQLRIRSVNKEPIFLIAQHQKRMIRDSFARLSCLTCFDYNGRILWQKGEANACWDTGLISCDLPFQIADINHDGKYEVIYSMDFEVIICDLLTGKIINKMPTPVIHNDPLVKNEPFYRLNVDAIRVADFTGLGYKGDFIIKDRYQNVWAYDHNMTFLWRYHHKNTGHFPYIYDFDGDGFDEMFVGYDMVDHDGTIKFSLPMNSDHTDEIIFARLHKEKPKQLILASGNEGVNIVNLDGTIAKHNEIGHAQRISVAKYDMNQDGLQIMATSFWGSNGIVCIYDCNGDLVCQREFCDNGHVITPISYDGKHSLAILNASDEGGLLDEELDIVVKFPQDHHPNLSIEVYDIDGDGIDEILCFDLEELWIYKAESWVPSQEYIKYSDDAFSNYRGEFLIPKEYD